MALDPTQIVANNGYGTQNYQARQTAIEGGQLENTQKQQGIDSNKIKQASEKLDYSLQTLAQVHDQASHEAWLMNMQKNGIDTTGDPTTYDPNWQHQSLVQGVSMKDQLQIQAMAAYRQNTLALKAAGTFGSVEEAARAGYRRAGDGVNWEPIDSTKPPMLGGDNPPQPQADFSTPPIAANPPPLPAGTPTLDSLPASEVANTPAGQDPIEAWKQANAQQTLSPATKPMDAAAIQQPQVNAPAQQVAAMPVQQPNPMAQQPGETVQHTRLRFQQQGGTQDGMIRSRMEATGEDYPTAASAIKNGIGMGNTVDANGKVVPRAGSLDASSQQAAAKSEGTESGKELGKQMETYRSAAEAAQGMDATLNAMKADSQKFRMGAWSETQGAAKSYLQALAQAAGVETPDLDSSLANQQAFTKSAMGLVMGGMQKVQGRAFGEMRAIQSAFPTQAMSKDGFDLVTSQIAGTNQYSEALYQAANDFKQKNGTLNGFESQFQKNISPWAYVVKNMNPAQLSDLSKSLSGTPEGQKELHMIADQIDYATKSGYMK